MRSRPINLAPDPPATGNSGAGESAAAPSGRLKLNILSHPANLREVRLAVEDLCRRVGVPQKATEDVGLCVNEALANVIRHAYGGATDRQIEIDASVADGQVRVCIRDWGRSVDPQRFLVPALRHDPLTPGGLGLICLRQLMDNVEFVPQNPGTLLIMTRSKQTP